MQIIKYPSIEEVNNAINADNPLLVLISFDSQKIIVSSIDEAVEHHVLLNKIGEDSHNIDKYFRIVLDSEGADWTFICPPNYKNISDKTHRISEFYKDGFTSISQVIQSLGYLVGIDIPRRYRRHILMLKQETEHS